MLLLKYVNILYMVILHFTLCSHLKILKALVVSKWSLMMVIQAETRWIDSKQMEYSNLID